MWVKSRGGRYDPRMIMYHRATGRYLEGPPAKGSGMWAFLKWLVGPPKRVYPKRPIVTTEDRARYRALIDREGRL